MYKAKDYRRFKELCRDKKYALAYAMGNKYPSLKHTAQYIEMEEGYQNSLYNAQKLVLLDKKDEAKAQIQEYITVLSKRDELQLITIHFELFKEFLKNYEDNNLLICYEMIDKNKILKHTNTAKLLQKHWEKLLKKAHKFSKEGNLAAVKETFGELLTLSTRLDKTTAIIKNSFHNKIYTLLEKKKFSLAEGIIYKYIDIFGKDNTITEIMKKFNLNSPTPLALIIENKKPDKYAWIDLFL